MFLTAGKWQKNKKTNGQKSRLHKTQNRYPCPHTQYGKSTFSFFTNAKAKLKNAKQLQEKGKGCYYLTKSRTGLY